MPSPFPGMDPYLEQPAVFPDLHDSMITYLRESLQRLLPEPYFAAVGDRVWVEISDRSVGPDVAILGQHAEKPNRRSFGPRREVQGSPSAHVVVTVPHDEHREPFLEIFSRLEGERLVTTIEILSLANKTPGARGRDLYVREQKEILESRVHLVEIDLLRAGSHTTAVPLERVREKAGVFEYHACVHRFDNVEDFFVYPVRLRDRLPAVSIPLLPEDGALAVDLQAVFDRTYDAGPYRRRVRYEDTAPVPPLGADDAEWARERIASYRARDPRE